MTAPAHRSILQLVRHAKSSWADPSVPDIDRPLSGRGRRAAQALARRLAEIDERPGVVLCSPAQRARETLGAIEGVLDASAEIRIEPVIYGGGPDDLLGVLRSLPLAAATVMVIGHNPTLLDLAIGLIIPDDSDDLARLRAKLPTGAMASLVVPNGWDQITFGSAMLRGFWTPR